MTDRDDKLFDEWQLQWWWPNADPSPDPHRLHAELNADAVVRIVESAIRDAIHRTPALRPLRITIAK